MQKRDVHVPDKGSLRSDDEVRALFKMQRLSQGGVRKRDPRLKPWATVFNTPRFLESCGAVAAGVPRNR